MFLQCGPCTTALPAAAVCWAAPAGERVIVGANYDDWTNKAGTARNMKILLVHNRYRTSAPSGEDAAVRNEQRMLERGGLETVLFDKCNDDLEPASIGAKLAMAADTIWSRRSRRELRVLLRRERPDVVHVHNTFAIVSPSIYGVCKEAGLPVVQTLHNFRFFCPGGLFLREGKPCEDCVDKGLLQSVRHRCYRDSFAATGTLAATLAFHRRVGTYARGIDRYIALTVFSRNKLLRAGIPADKLTVKPNFVPDPPLVCGGGGDYVAFVGRLSYGKGAETLLSAWREFPGLKLKIVGDGELRPTLESTAKREAQNVEFLGFQDRSVVLDVIGNARFVIVPSECYETFGLVIAEAFACGTPVLASRIGSLDELVLEGVTGHKFESGDPADLARVTRLMLTDEVALRRMRVAARAYFDAHLTEERNLELLTGLYARLIDANRASVLAAHRGSAH
jgi:glycosyltransferase involved in cell wall biosynthesis